MRHNADLDRYFTQVHICKQMLVVMRALNVPSPTWVDLSEDSIKITWHVDDFYIDLDVDAHRNVRAFLLEFDVAYDPISYQFASFNWREFIENYYVPGT